MTFGLLLSDGPAEWPYFLFAYFAFSRSTQFAYAVVRRVLNRHYTYVESRAQSVPSTRSRRLFDVPCSGVGRYVWRAAK